jgi:hypothetical protein
MNRRLRRTTILARIARGKPDRLIGQSDDPCIGNLKIAGDVAESVGEIGADRSHDYDGRSRDQVVFDRRNPALVFDQAENSRVFEAIVSIEGCSDTKVPAKFVINADEI